MLKRFYKKNMKRRGLNNKTRKEDILRLRSEGKTYSEIVKELGCSKALVSYHCGNGNEKKRLKEAQKKKSPLDKKISHFKCRCARSSYQKISNKVKTFKRRSKMSGNQTSTIVNNITKNYSCKDVIKKIGKNPVCYLTGESIDLNKPETYNLDHVIPSSRGGTNDLNNLQICIKEANSAKSDLMVEELYDLCEKILAWRDKLSN